MKVPGVVIWAQVDTKESNIFYLNLNVYCPTNKKMYIFFILANLT